MMREQTSDRTGGAPQHAYVEAALPAIVRAPVAPTIGLPTLVRRIATFHLNGLGDLIFTLPALQALRESFPDASICAVVRPALASLLKGSLLVDEVLLRPKEGGLFKQIALMRQLHARHFDICVAFSQSRITTLLAWGSGAPTRIGLGGAKMESLLTHHVPKEHAPYTVETHLDLVRALGCHPHQLDARGLLQVPPSHFVEAERLLLENNIGGAFIIAACEASPTRGIKEWLAEHWAQTLDELAVDLPVVLVGTQPTPAVSSLMRNPVLDLGGRTDLSTLAALCARARLFVGIDSGVLHLATAMGTPVVGIYGPSDWRLTGPRGVPSRVVRQPAECSPCALAKCRWQGADERKCLRRLQPQSVIAAAHELLTAQELPAA